MKAQQVVIYYILNDHAFSAQLNKICFRISLTYEAKMDMMEKEFWSLVMELCPETGYPILILQTPPCLMLNIGDIMA